MTQPSTRIPIEHSPMIHEVEMTAEDSSSEVTLLELIEAVSEVSETEQEVIATVTYMLKSGRIRLSDNDREESIARLCG